MAYASWHTTVTDLQGNVIPNASIYVVNETTGIAPQLYADRQGLVPMGNPFTAEADGTVNLYVIGGAYRIRASFGAWERTWRYVGIGTAQEYDIDGLGAYLQSGLIYTQTRSELNAITPTDFPAGGVVLADPVGANNGYYTNQGSGWVFARPLPDTFGRLYATGGTANNVQATLDAGVNPSSPTVFFIDVITPNTGPVTLTVNGQNEGPVLNAAGNPLAAGEWQGRVLFTRESNGDYKILNDPASALSAAQSASEASSQADRAEIEADRAEAAASTVSNPVSYNAQTPSPAEQAQARENIGAKTISFASVAEVSAAQVSPSLGFISTAGYYAPGDGGSALYKRATSEPAHAGKFQSADGAWWELAEKRAHARMFGAVIDGVTDDTDAYQKLCEFCAATGSDPDFGAGHSILSRQITLPLNRTIYGGDITFDFLGVTGADDFPNGAHVYVDGGEPTALPNLSANVVAGQKTLSFVSAPDVVPGDIVIIRNPTDGSFNSVNLIDRAYYRAGEYCLVRSVSGSTVTLWGGTIAGYGSGDVTVHRFARDNKLNFDVARFRVLASTVVGYGINFRRLRHARHDNVEAIGGRFGACYRQECYDISGDNVRFEQDLLSGQGVDYGLVDGGCQITRARGIFAGMRHGYSAGNGGGLTVPCRFMDIEGDFYTGQTNHIGCANTHGNCEFWRFAGNFYGTVNFGGDMGRVEGDIFVENVDKPALSGTELLGLSFDFTGVRVHASGNNSGAAGGGFKGLLDCGGNGNAMASHTVRGGVLKFENMEINAPNNIRMLTVTNRGATASTQRRWGVSLRGTRYMGDGSSNSMRILADSGDNFDFLDLEGFVNNANNAYTVSGVNRIRGWRESGNAVVTPSTSAPLVDHAVTFRRQAPRAPFVNATTSGTINSGTARLISFVAGSTAEGFTVRLVTSDNENFQSDTPRNVNWVATLDE